MADPFVNIFLYFNSRKILFRSLLLLSMLMIGLAASHIRFSEDISATVGATKKDIPALTLNNLRFTDRIIVMIHQEDSLHPPDPDLLVEQGMRFTSELQTRADSSLIHNLLFSISDSAMEQITGFVASHLPSFLTGNDYRWLDSITQPEMVEMAMKKNHQILLTPAGMVLKNRLGSDPLGIINRALLKLKSLQAGDDFTLYNGCIVTRDFKYLLIFIDPEYPSSETSRNDELISAIDDAIHVTDTTRDKIKITYFGGPAIAVANARQLKSDILVTLMVAILLIFLLVGFYFRNLLVPLTGLLPAVFGGSLALALLSITKGTISVISLGIGSVILGLIVDYSLYIVNQYIKRDSMAIAVRELSLTIILCAVTSAGAFLCLTFLQSSVLHDLGWFAAISVLGAALFSLIVIPQLIPAKLSSQATRGIRLIDSVAGIQFGRKPWILLILVAVALLSAFYGRKAGFLESMSSLSFMTPELKKAESELNSLSTFSEKNLFVVSSGSDIETALRNQERIMAHIDSMKQHAIISDINNAGPLLQSDSMQALRLLHWNHFWTPERKTIVKARIAKAALAYGFNNTAFRGFENVLDRTYQPFTIKESTGLAGSMAAGWLGQTGTQALSATILKVPAVNVKEVYRLLPDQDPYTVFDRQRLTDNFVERVKNDFELLVTLTMLFVTILLIVSFGRLGLGIITAIPMFFSWIVTLGFMGITGVTFNIFNIIISSFIFGLGVDYSILMMRGLQQQLITGRDDLKTYRVSVLLSALTTLFGTSALFFARHPALNSIASVSLVGILAVVLGSFTIEHYLFEHLILKRARNGKFPVTMMIALKTVVTWANIVAIALLLMISGWIIKTFPVPKKRKEMMFHHLFSFFSKIYITATFGKKSTLINTTGEDFTKPAIIISNHQSLIETPAFLRLHPKILILTSSWVYKSPVFGPVARLANFFNTDVGIDQILPQLQEKFNEGFSLLIFPEGHRSDDHHIHRFHRGAFYISRQLNIDILPMMVFGSGDFLPRNAFWGRPNYLRMKIMPRIPSTDLTFGNSYQERARHLRQWYIQEYRVFRHEQGNTAYYRRLLALNYVLKGPVLEWYMRIKMKLENHYALHHTLMPQKGEILDLGCGYGFMTYMLMLSSEERDITGVDFDSGKITLASNNFAANNRIRFVCSDIMDYPVTPKAGIILGDVLHYLRPEQQDELLVRCFRNLLPDGVILVRDADSDLSSLHRQSKLTEFFSTRSGFNKTGNAEKKLWFTNAGHISDLADREGLSVVRVDENKRTSNSLWMIKHMNKGE